MTEEAEKKVELTTEQIEMFFAVLKRAPLKGYNEKQLIGTMLAKETDTCGLTFTLKN